MGILAASTGDFPANEASTPPQRLREVIADQIACGLDWVTDGQVSWRDPVSHIAGSLTGVQVGEPAGYFDSGISIRRPRIRGPFAWAVPVVRPEFERAQAISAKPVKPVLTGALTMARHSAVLDPYYRRDFARLVSEYNEALVREVHELAKAGAEIIQIDEPAILRDHEPEDWRIVKSCWRRLASVKGQGRLLLNPGWGDPAPLLEELLRVPADIVALDLTANPRLADIIAYAKPERVFQLGVVDGFNPALEDREKIAQAVGKVWAALDGECLVSPNAGLRTLPRENACAKLKMLADVCAALREAGPPLD